MRDGFFELADAPQDSRLEVAQPRVRRIVGEQGVRLAHRRFGLVSPVQHHRVVLPRDREPRRELEAAREQHFGIRDPADPGRDFGEHADCGDVGGIVPQMFTQQLLRFGDAVLAERQGRHQKLWIARRMADLLRKGVVRGIAHLERRVVVTECAPRIRLRRIEMHRAAQGFDGLFALAKPAEREAEQCQPLGVIGNDLENFIGLFGRRGRIASQQALAIRQCEPRRTQRFGRFLGHRFFGVPARSLISRYHISRPA